MRATPDSDVLLIDEIAAATRRLGSLGSVPAYGVKLYARGLGAAERIALRTLRARLDAVAPVADLPRASDNGRFDSTSPAQLMADLLDRLITQDLELSTASAHVAILRQLVPDEARIIAALATGPPAPLVNVLSRTSGEPILENASLIGRMAAVTRPSQTPSYVSHLLALGLVEAGPEDRSSKEQYELLMADRDVRAALKQGELSKLPARTVRRTLVLSADGLALWEATQQ
jgi:hypothetical protein